MDYGTNSKDIIGKKVRFIVETDNDIPDRGNVGDVCFVADTSEFYIAGMTGWFGYGFDNYIEFPTEEEESGTVLFDGVVTLEESHSGAGFRGEIELTAMPVLGNAYTITINGHSFSGVAVDDDGAILIRTGTEESGVSLDVYEGIVTFWCSTGVGQAGENTLKIVQTD